MEELPVTFATAPESVGGVYHIGPHFVIRARPHVRMFLRRIFLSAQEQEGDEIKVDTTMDNAETILWVMLRYPLIAHNGAAELLKELADAAAARREKCRLVLMTQPPPMPTLLPLRDYQVQAVHLLAAQKVLMIGDDFGLGKTVCGVGAMAAGALPAIVVCQVHLQRQWQDEIEKFVSGVKVHVAKTTRPYDLPKHNVLILPYSKLSGWRDAVAEIPYKMIVFDEAQELRHDNSIKYTAAGAIAARIGVRLLLTATPVYNYGDEIYNLLQVMSPGCLGSKREFHAEWCQWNGKHYLVTDPKALGSYLAGHFLFLRRRRHEVGRELPPLNKVVQSIENKKDVIEKMERQAFQLAKTVLGGTFLERGKAALELSAFVRQQTGIAKAPFVAEFIADMVKNGEPVVMWAWHRECLAAGTKVIMADGSLRNVEDVQKGESLLGPDSTPRMVLDTIKGRGKLFRVIPNRGDSWVCSENHIIPVWNNKMKRFEKWTAAQMASKSKRWMQNRNLFRAGVCRFSGESQTLEPWLMGYWLGDGAADIRDFRVISNDAEIDDECEAIAKRHGLLIRRWAARGITRESTARHLCFSTGGKKTAKETLNPLILHFRKLGLHKNKHIPASYLTASTEDRMEILAGLIDSDGHVYQNANSKGTVEFTNVNRRLAEEVAFLARSLGFAANINTYKVTCGYLKKCGGDTIAHRVNISGHVEEIPCRIFRKRLREKRSGQKNVLHVGFKIVEEGRGDFFGFELDGDHLFLLEDFTVAHNCYHIIRTLLRGMGIRTVMYTGSESPRQKDEAVRAFVDGDANGKADVFMMSLRSGAGLNRLQERCSVGVVAELDWSPQVIEQCAGRLRRDGQDSRVTIIYLVSEDGSDPVVANVLGIKAGQSEGIINPDADVDDSNSLIGRQAEEARAGALARAILEKYHGK